MGSRKMKAKQKQQQELAVANESSLISDKYQPRRFQEIAGHKIVIDALSNAVLKKKIAPLYLFHGPNGTGKTSAARIFAMALNCESTAAYNNNKPCCSCKGCCSMSLIHTTGNRISSVPRTGQQLGYSKVVVIIEECHLLTVEAWDEIGMNASNHVVFVLITHLDVTAIRSNISSRCHKFHFGRLNDDDITESLSRIIVNEGLVMEKEALKLIVAKSQGSLREAQNILDQLALLGPNVNTSAVKQLVGLIPQTELLDLLAVAASGDTINIIRNAKKLMSECGVGPASFVSQLTSLITEDSPPCTSLLSKPRVCSMLKLLVATEKQIISSSSTTDQTSNVIDALLDLSSNIQHATPTHASLHTDAERRRSLSDMEQLWKDVLKGMQSSRAQKFLSDQAKLTLLSVSKSNANVHLTFTRQEDKMAADISQESLAKALEVAIGCPVTLQLSLDLDEHEPSTSKSLQRYSTQASKTRHDKQQPVRRRRASLSSIPSQSDAAAASVEPYSQDVMYANGAPRFSKSSRFLEPADSNLAWCC